MPRRSTVYGSGVAFADPGGHSKYTKRRICELRRNDRTRRLKNKKASVLKQHFKCYKNTRHGAVGQSKSEPEAAELAASFTSPKVIVFVPSLKLKVSSILSSYR